MTDLADIYSTLLRDPFWLRIEHLRRLTDRQIVGLYFYKRVKSSTPEPESEEDIRGWCLETGAMLGKSAEATHAWADRMVAKWREDQRSRNESPASK